MVFSDERTVETISQQWILPSALILSMILNLSAAWWVSSQVTTEYRDAVNIWRQLGGASHRVSPKAYPLRYRRKSALV